MTNKIYEYLLKNCLGFENRIKGNQLMDIFGINDNKTLRSYIEVIRQNEEYEYLVGSEAGPDGGYFITTTEDEKTQSTNHIYLRAQEQLKTCEMMENKKIYEVA